MQHHAHLVRLAEPLHYNHPDSTGEVLVLDYERLGIDQARELQQMAYRTPADATTQTLVVRFLQTTVEAQNALLKLLEEPPATTKFVLVTAPGLQLLPTLLSRVVAEEIVSTEQTDVWQVFLDAPIAERMKQIEVWQKNKDAQWLQQLQNGLRDWLSAEQATTPSKITLLVTERLGTRGASNKMLLEALALDEQLQN